MLEHQYTRQQDRARVDLVLARILRRRAVGGLEHAVAGDVVDVGARCDTDATHLRGESVGQVVAVEVHGGDHVEVFRTGEHLLQRDVGDVVLDEDLVARLAAAIVPADRNIAELFAHELVAPIHEGAFGELHDVALVHQRDRLAFTGDRVVDRGALQTLRAVLRDRLDADTRVFTNLPTERIIEQLAQFLGLGSERLDLEAGVDVFDVLAKDHHVDLFGTLHRRRHALEPSHRAQADIQIEDLA